jgi:hypothetical protein
VRAVDAAGNFGAYSGIGQTTTGAVPAKWSGLPAGLD